MNNNNNTIQCLPNISTKDIQGGDLITKVYLCGLTKG